MRIVPLVTVAMLAACVGACNQKVSSDGVLERASVPPPPSERGSGLGGEQAPTAVADETPSRRTRTLAVPAR
jgi:hypothetical protein